MNKEGTLLARYSERKMSPVTGLDTTYVHEWRLIRKPVDAGNEWMGNEYGIERIFTKGGEEVSRDLMETGMTPSKVVATLPWEGDYKNAEKFGVAKTHFDKVMAEREVVHNQDMARLKKDAEEQERYNQKLAELGTYKGVKKGLVGVAEFAWQKKEGDKTFTNTKTQLKQVAGFDVGRGVGVAISGERS